MKKLLLGLLVALSVTAASAFTREECSIAATNIFYAQSTLNEAPARFKETTANIRKAPASDYQWSKSLKKFILGIADRLKEGADPQKVGQAVFDACVNKKSV